LIKNNDLEEIREQRDMDDNKGCRRSKGRALVYYIRTNRIMIKKIISN